MTKYWMAVASKQHVELGVLGGFAQVCHGKKGPLSRMKEKDWIIYYSPTVIFGEKDPCQSFTAIGRIATGSAYPFEMSPNFIPWRINVHFEKCHETKIKPLLENLSFITDKKKWGFPFRRGCFEINKQDFALIANKMGVSFE